MSAGGGSGGAGAEEGAEKEAKSEHVQEPTEKPQPQPQPNEQQPSLQDDPFEGIYSERMRQRIESDAFRTSSATAQDSAISSAADRLLQPELRSVLTRDVPPIDISPAARRARIDALAGEIPKWARGDVENDPSVLRTLASVRDSKMTSVLDSKTASDLASNREANGVCLREPAKALAPASPAAHAASIGQRIEQRAVSEPAREAAQPPAQLPAQPSCAAAGRDFER
jgi:hypothetical protein